MVNPYEAPKPSDTGEESDFSWRSSVVRCLSSYLLLVMSATVFVAGFSLAFVGVATQLHILMSLFGVGMCVLGLAGMLVAWRTSNRGALANGVVQLTDWPNEGATERIGLELANTPELGEEVSSGGGLESGSPGGESGTSRAENKNP